MKIEDELEAMLKRRAGSVAPDDEAAWSSFEQRRRNNGRGSSSEHGLSHRAFAGVVAAAVALAGFAFLVAAFRPDERREGPPPALGSDTVTLLVSSSGPSGDEAFLRGTLTIQSGCVAVSGGPGTSVTSVVYVVWPAGYTLEDDGERTWLLDDSRNRVASIGDQVEMAGGITNLAHAEPAVEGGIPAPCEVEGPDAYWFAGTPERVTGSSPAEAHATFLPGLDDYKVCRVQSLPGDFGDGGDEVVVFEEERIPGAGCVNSEGFQHVAVLRDGMVTGVSRRLTDAAIDAWRVWPYATPDLDGDGIDEIAVANVPAGTTKSVWFLRLSTDLYSGGLTPIVYIHNGAGPFEFPIDDSTPTGEIGDSGMYCDDAAGGRQVVTWARALSADDQLAVTEARWELTGALLRLVVQGKERTIEGQEYGALLNEDLCGSPVSPVVAYPASS